MKKFIIPSENKAHRVVLCSDESRIKTLVNLGAIETELRVRRGEIFISPKAKRNKLILVLKISGAIATCAAIAGAAYYFI